MKRPMPPQSCVKVVAYARNVRSAGARAHVRHEQDILRKASVPRLGQHLRSLS